MRKRTTPGSADLACPRSGVRSDVEKTVLMKLRLSMEFSLIEDPDNHRPSDGLLPALITAIKDEAAEQEAGHEAEKSIFPRCEASERRGDIRQSHPRQRGDEQKPEDFSELPAIIGLRHIDLHIISRPRPEGVAHSYMPLGIFCPCTKRPGRAVAAGDPRLRLHPSKVILDADDCSVIPHGPFSAGRSQGSGISRSPEFSPTVFSYN